MSHVTWSAVRLEPYRERLALIASRAGYETYCPRILRRRFARGRKVETMPLLFSLRRGRRCARGKVFRVSLDLKLCLELERAAAVRGLEPEVLLNAVGRVVVRDHLINAVLDGLP